MHFKPFCRAGEQVWNSKWQYINPCHAYRNTWIILTQIMLRISFCFLSMQLQVKPLELVEGLQTHYLLNMALGGVCVHIYVYTYTKDWKENRTMKNFDPTSLIKYLWRGYYASIYCPAHCLRAYTLIVCKASAGWNQAHLHSQIFALKGIMYGVSDVLQGPYFLQMV